MPNIDWNASDYQKHFSFVPSYGESVMELLTKPEGAFVVDLGCGNGAERAFYCLAQKSANFTNISASVKSALFFIPQRNACSVVCTQETVTLVQSSEGQMPI